ncbi:MAG: Fe-S cluster assembly ATPase SufC [Exilibacterium sp.]
MLQIRDLAVSVDDKTILKGINLTVNAGEVHAIMGPNGSGKSVLTRTLSGDPQYRVERGQVLFKQRNLLELEPEERARLGVFLGFQYPVSIPGVSNVQFLKAALNAQREACGEEPLDAMQLLEKVRELLPLVDLNPAFLQRAVNDGFSGGEKKRNEILQMLLLEPALCVLDETDSGLDVDALKTVADGINHMRAPQRGFLLITHYQRLLNYVKPDVVHILARGKIVASGGPELALEVEQKGYQHLAA